MLFNNLPCFLKLILKKELCYQCCSSTLKFKLMTFYHLLYTESRFVKLELYRVILIIMAYKYIEIISII